LQIEQLHLASVSNPFSGNLTSASTSPQWHVNFFISFNLNFLA